jgi:hypothetical protein
MPFGKTADAAIASSEDHKLALALHCSVQGHRRLIRRGGSDCLAVLRRLFRWFCTDRREEQQDTGQKDARADVLAIAFSLFHGVPSRVHSHS